MAWNDADELVVPGTGQVYFAPVGTPLPTDDPDAALNSAFIGAGFLTEDGVSTNVAPDITEIRAFQSRQPIRREFNGQNITAAFTMQQWNESNVPLAFGGGAVTSPATGVYRYDFPDEDQSLDERCIVIDIVDGDVHHRFVFQRGNVTEGVESAFTRSNPALLPVTFGVLEPDGGGAPGWYLTDSPDFAAGS